MSKIFIFFLITSTLLAFDVSRYSQSVKEKKIYPMGKKLYENKCTPVDAAKFDTLEKLHNYITVNKICKPMNKKQQNALLLYLFEKQNSAGHSHMQKIVLKDGEKCPVCGMFIHKYPRWASQIVYEKERYSFDGVKDMMKFYFNPKEFGNYETGRVKSVIVRDYYTQKEIDGLKAYYVIGSDVYGPMGLELIPFHKESDAKKFFMDHRGTQVLRFDEINEKKVYSLDE